MQLTMILVSIFKYESFGDYILLNSEHAKTEVKQEYEKSIAELKEISDKVKEQLNRFKTKNPTDKQ